MGMYLGPASVSDYDTLGYSMDHVTELRGAPAKAVERGHGLPVTLT